MSDAQELLVTSGAEWRDWLTDESEDCIVPDDLGEALAAMPPAAAEWASFSTSSRKAILWWIASMKQPETRAKRIAEAAGLASRGLEANQWPREGWELTGVSRSLLHGRKGLLNRGSSWRVSYPEERLAVLATRSGLDAGPRVSGSAARR